MIRNMIDWCMKVGDVYWPQPAYAVVFADAYESISRVAGLIRIYFNKVRNVTQYGSLILGSGSFDGYAPEVKKATMFLSWETKQLLLCILLSKFIKIKQPAPNLSQKLQ